MKYTAADVSKLTTFAPWPNGVEMQPTVSKNYPPHLAVPFYLNLVLICFFEVELMLFPLSIRHV